MLRAPCVTSHLKANTTRCLSFPASIHHISIWRTPQSTLEEECTCLYFHRHAVLHFFLKQFSPFVLFRAVVAIAVGVAAGAGVGVFL